MLLRLLINSASTPSGSIIGTSKVPFATSGEGLYEGLDCLSNNIANKVKSIPFFNFSTI
ncbi:hypothetical protein Patl1_11832 [Pistacia atlantica]|uniref:Uncharacterized protein n=1 Tax=Pistacia atlantica TaxID=434234 RepID=A0ACC1A4E3_9ROSI|nr:hypothetical protein Patl1_11832 [Pistacia atlantica]